MSKLTFSVVIPVRNEAKRLARCLKAVFSQSLARERFEVIVVDGRSTDGTRELVKGTPARLLVDGGVSVSEARNRGIAAAGGDVVAFTDGDCVPRLGWLSALARRFEAEPGVAGVGGALEIEDLGNVVSRMEGLNARAMYRGFITSNAAYRREVLLELAGFDASLRCGEDWDLLWRAREAGHVVVFEPSAVVVHAPEEHESPRAYFRRQFWYARTDVPTFAKRAERLVRSGGTSRRRMGGDAPRVVGPSLVHAGGVAAMAASPLVGSPLVAVGGLAFLAGEAVHRTVRVARACPALGPGELGAFLAFHVGRGLVRGAGTFVGVSDLLARALRGRRRASRARCASGPRSLERNRRKSQDPGVRVLFAGGLAPWRT